MPYGDDFTVFVVDDPAYTGAPPTPAPWWISPDIEIPAHQGAAVQGTNTVQARVHAHDEPILQVKINAEVYVGNPSLAMSPTTGTKRIDPGLKFRTVDVPGTEPVANEAGATATFDWTPSASASDVDGPGHRCLLLRAFPEDVTPPTDPFNVPFEVHEAQHNLEILTTTTVPGMMKPGQGGAGTPHSPRQRDEATGTWWERLSTVGRGKAYVIAGFDPNPSEKLAQVIRQTIGHPRRTPLSKEPPQRVELAFEGARGREIDPHKLGTGVLGEQSGVGHGVFVDGNLLAGAEVELRAEHLATAVLRFDHSNLDAGTAVVLHVAQFDHGGRPQGGMTIVALAPTRDKHT